jgi:hypothetical protein
VEDVATVQVFVEGPLALVDGDAALVRVLLEKLCGGSTYQLTKMSEEDVRGELRARYEAGEIEFNTTHRTLNVAT